MATKTEVTGLEQQERTPLIQLRNVEIGKRFVGRLLGPVKEMKKKDGDGTNYIYEFAALDGNCEFIKFEGTKVVPMHVEANATVALFATTPLHRKLKDVAVGQKVEIEYRGQRPLKNNPKKSFHDYGVFLIEEA